MYKKYDAFKYLKRKILNPIKLDVFRKFFLYEPPIILTLNIKRFVRRTKFRFEKVADYIEVPLKLNIDPYTIHKCCFNNFLN